MHHICLKLFSLPLAKLHIMYNLCLENHITNPNSNGYKLVLYIARNRLFKPAVIKKEEIYKLFFFNFRLPTHVLIPLAYSISFITNQSNLQFRYILKSVPILSCNYTTPIAAILFNYKNGKQDLNIDDFKFIPPDCTLQVPPFIYTLAVNVVDVDLHIINNNYLRDIFSRADIL